MTASTHAATRASTGTAASPEAAGTPGVTHAPPMTHRQVLEALSGLVLALFVAMLSSTIITTALPTIVADLDGSQAGYAWVMVASLLALTVTTPIWGKLADLLDKKALVQTALAIYTAGSIVAGFSVSMEMLIGARLVQGVGVGGLSALVMIVLAEIVSPRDRGRYFGYVGAAFAVATVSGPLVGGIVVDTDWLGWRWCFFVGVPVAIVAFLVLGRTLRLPRRPRREVRIDYLGATLIATAASLLLIWVTLGGSQIAWDSGASYALALGGLTLVVAAVIVESRAPEPVVPLRLFRVPAISLGIVASVATGVAIFGVSLFVVQYLQVARGFTPTHAGLLSLPLVLGMYAGGAGSGSRITRHGHWKRYVVTGAALALAGLIGLALLTATTPLLFIGAAMTLVGLGVGALQQNTVLVAQNAVGFADAGASSSLVMFFRTLGGAAGLAFLGAALGRQVAAATAAGVPEPVAYGDGIATVFAWCVPLMAVALVAVALLPNTPLRQTIHSAEELADELG